METTQKGRRGWMSWGLVVLALSLAAGTLPLGRLLAAEPVRGGAGARLAPAARVGALPAGRAAALRRVLGPGTPTPRAAWSPQGELTASDAAAYDFGVSAALDKDTALVGAFGKNGDAGVAYVFGRSGSTWTEQAELTAPDGAAGDFFGRSVALSGTTALIGAYGKNSRTGVAYVFERRGTTWSQQAELTAPDGATNDIFGFSVALHGDIALIGAPGKNNQGGAAYVFGRSGTSWSQQAELTAPDGATIDNFGFSVALNKDTALVGAYGKNSRTGAAYVFGRSDSTWSQQAELTARDAAASDFFGSSVSLSGTTALIGAYGKNSRTGAAYVFVRSGTTWSQQAELTARDGAAGDNFGSSVSLSGDTALVGADGKNRFAGAAYVFGRRGTAWSQQAKLTARDEAPLDTFSTSVALHGSTALVGAPGKNTGAGAAYVFGRSGTTGSVEDMPPNSNAVGSTNTWTTTGSLSAQRELHTATLLPDGRVLVGGGVSVEAVDFASAELYDPRSSRWTATGRMATPRWGHTATLLPSGQILVAGGNRCGGCPILASAERYDPATGTWRATGRMGTARSYHTATLLPNGKVLVTGGATGTCCPGPATTTAELYDPRTGTWSPTGRLATARENHTATLLPNGKVLVAGGNGGTDSHAVASAELYDPASGAWSPTGRMGVVRTWHTATLLPSGKVLVAGGSACNGCFAPVAEAELYDVRAGTWSPTGHMNSPRLQHIATLLRNGRVLVAGGIGIGSLPVLASAELYDAGTGRWTSVASMAVPRQVPTATLLPSGQVLVAAGCCTTSAELFTPAGVVPPTSQVPSLIIHVSTQSAVSRGALPIRIATLPDARVVITLRVPGTRTMLSQTRLEGTADARGQFSGVLRSHYVPVKPVQATLTVTVLTAQGTVTRTVTVTLVH